MAGIKLDEAEQDLILQEAGYFSGRVQNPAAQSSYRRMQQEASQGELSEDLLGPLGELLKVGMTNGRIRSVHGAHAEMAATSLFRRTPQGKALQAGVSEVNQALSVLQGQAVEKVTVSARGPGIYSVIIETDQSRLLVSLTPQGVEIRNVEVSM